MPLDYDTDSKLKALAPVLDDHAEWFARAVKRIFYTAEFKDADALGVPESFDKWITEAEGYDFMEAVTLSDLKKLFGELHMVAKGLTDKAAFGQEKITLKEFDDFTSLYENFIFKLHRLEHDCALVDSGLDIESGLRSASAMRIDIDRELERRARRGNPFTLALARIDNHDELRQKLSVVEYNRIIKVIGRLIKKCIRSFDDAYRSEDGEFIMSLKHSEAVGGTAAVNRLRSYLEEEKLSTELDGKKVRITMSYCVAEPVPGDTLAELLVNMRRDLDKWDDGGNTALEYQEQSPLQRFIGDAE